MYSFKDFVEHGIIIPDGSTPNASGNIHMPCPECSKTRTHSQNINAPVLGVHIEKGCWRCNHCGWTGSLKKTIKIEEKFSTKLRMVNVNYNYDINHAGVKWFWDNRKISVATLRKNRIFFNETSVFIKHSKDLKLLGKYALKNCVHYPYHYEGEIVNLKWRDANKNFGALSGGHLVFYGIDDIQHDDWCIIVEGENDKLAWSEVGIQNCMSVPNGSVITEDEKKRIINGEVVESQMNLEYLDNCYDKLNHIKRFIIATDDDPAGIKLRNELARRLGKHRCCYVTYNGKKDSNQLLIEEGVDALKAILNNANDFPIDNIVFAKDVYTELEYEYVHGKVKGKSTGWKCLDPHFTLRKGDMIIGNGYGGMGKTTFSFNVVINTALMYNWKWGIYTPENYPERRVYDLLAEILIGNSSDRDYQSRMSLTEYKSAIMGFLQKHIYLVRGNRRYTPKELNDKFSEMISRLGIIGVIKDPWNNLKHNMKNRTLDDYLEDALSDEVEFATRNEVVSMINAHPPTPPRDRLSSLPAPTVFMIRGGAIWSAKAYVIYCIHQRRLDDVKDMTVEFHMQKSKDNKTIGYKTKEDEPILLEYRHKSNRFYELSIQGGGKWINPIEENKTLLFEQLNLKING